MSEDIQIVGLAELKLALDEFPDKLQNNVMRGAIRAGLKQIANEAKSRVPVATGALKKSIRVSARIQDGNVVGFVKAGSRVKGGSQKSGAARGAFYAHMVEFGTAAHVIRSLNAKALGIAGGFAKSVKHPGAQMHAFFRPAIATKSQAAMEAFAAYIRKRLDKLNQVDNNSES